MIAAAPLILIVTTTSFLASNVPIPLTIRRTAPGSSMTTYVMSETESGDGAAPSLRDQMQAYLKSVQERGVELTAEQKAMIAEFEGDDELLDQTGLVDTYKGADVMTPEEFEALQQDDKPATTAATIPAAIPAPVPSAPPATPTPASAMPAVVPDTPLDPAMARLWLMQQNERETAVQLLQKRVDGGAPLGLDDAFQLRKALTSLICTLAATA